MHPRCRRFRRGGDFDILLEHGLLKERLSALLTDAIREEWAKAIVDTQSAEPDAITSATLKISAGAVQEAAAEILEKIR